MSALDTVPPQVIEEAKLALADAAGTAARRNQPRFLLIAGVLAIVAAGTYAVACLASRASASAALDAEQTLTSQVRTEVDALLAIKSDESAQVTSPRYTPNLRLIADLEKIANAVALTGVTFADSNDLRSFPPGMQRKKYTASMTNVDAQAMLAWMTRAVSEIQGLETSAIQLNPGVGTPDGKPRWSGVVIFTRWERTGS